MYETTTFYSESKILWKSPDYDLPTPRIFGIGRTKAHCDTKLAGRYVWPFTFSMPHEFEVRKVVARQYKLQSSEVMPPTLGGNAGNSSIDYQITVDVKRRGILQVDATYV